MPIKARIELTMVRTAKGRNQETRATLGPSSTRYVALPRSGPVLRPAYAFPPNERRVSLRLALPPLSRVSLSLGGPATLPGRFALRASTGSRMPQRRASSWRAEETLQAGSTVQRMSAFDPLRTLGRMAARLEIRHS
jgi:hypothetical protein